MYILAVIVFLIVAKAIKERIPEAEVVFNMVPKEFAMSDIYCQLIPNDDDKNPYYEVIPRIGSFEVSFNGVVSILIISLLKFADIVALLQVLVIYVAKLPSSF